MSDVARSLPRGRRVLFHGIVALVSLVLGLVVLERWLRMFPPAENETFAWWRAHTQSFLEDPDVGWKLEPRVYGPTICVNESFFRGEPLAPGAHPGRTRIIVTGGSAAFDYFKTDEHAWPKYLETMLRCTTGHAVEVLNAATPGYSTWQSLLFLKTRLMAWNPDLVLHYELYNDSLYFRLPSRDRILEGWRRNAEANYVGGIAHPGSVFDVIGRVLPRTSDFLRMGLVKRVADAKLRSTLEIFGSDRLDGHVTPVGLGFYEESLRGMAAFLASHGNVPRDRDASEHHLHGQLTRAASVDPLHAPGTSARWSRGGLSPGVGAGRARCRRRAQCVLDPRASRALSRSGELR